MIKNKEWYKSKTIWAALASLLVAILSALLGETNIFVTVAIAVFSAIGLYGRATAYTAIK